MNNEQALNHLQEMMRSAVDSTVANIKELNNLEDEAYENKREELEQEPYGVNVTQHYELILAGGGPSMWIEGEIEDGVPITAKLQSSWYSGVQELRLTSQEEDALIEYASLHYFGER